MRDNAVSRFHKHPNLGLHKAKDHFQVKSSTVLPILMREWGEQVFGGFAEKMM